MENDYYDPDDVFYPDRSPALKAVNPRLSPDLQSEVLHATEDGTEYFDLVSSVEDATNSFEMVSHRHS